MEISKLEQVISINRHLENLYGKHQVKNLPNFRLAYAGDQYEKRRGTFNVYIDGTDVFLRTETGIKEVKKYAYIDDDTWIMERIIPNCHQAEVEGDYIYECFYAFKKIDHVPPLRAVIFLMNSLMTVGGVARTQEEIDSRAPRNQAEADRRYKEKLEKEKKATRAMLDEKFDYTDISLQLKHGSAVTDFNSKMKDPSVDLSKALPIER